jgi:hypothetical protein
MHSVACVVWLFWFQRDIKVLNFGNMIALLRAHGHIEHRNQPKSNTRNVPSGSSKPYSKSPHHCQSQASCAASASPSCLRIREMMKHLYGLGAAREPDHAATTLGDTVEEFNAANYEQRREERLRRLCAANDKADAKDDKPGACWLCCMSGNDNPYVREVHKLLAKTPAQIELLTCVDIVARLYEATVLPVHNAGWSRQSILEHAQGKHDV